VDEVHRRLGEIETALAAEDIACAGVFICIAHDGRLDINRG